MKAQFCYWSIADGPYAVMARALIRSARAVGVLEDFHVWTDSVVEGAILHDSGKLDKAGCLFKLTFLRYAVQALDYEHFMWLDADSFFVRNPGCPLRVLRKSPMHVTLESDLCARDNRRKEWWGCPSPVLVGLMRDSGIRTRQVFNLNGGMFIVQRNAIERLCTLAFDFFEHGRRHGYVLNDEPLLAYAMHMLCDDPHTHNLRVTSDLWAEDWQGVYRDSLPDGQPWCFDDYFTGERLLINPAIVHVMHSKSALMAYAAQAKPK